MVSFKVSSGVSYLLGVPRTGDQIDVEHCNKVNISGIIPA